MRNGRRLLSVLALAASAVLSAAPSAQAQNLSIQQRGERRRHEPSVERRHGRRALERVARVRMAYVAQAFRPAK